MFTTRAQQGEEPEEPSLRRDISALLRSDDVDGNGGSPLSDLILKSRVDGAQIAVHKLILAARSPVFRTMLYSSFAEASRPVVEIDGYSGVVLRSVVDYIYTDETSLLLPIEEEGRLGCSNNAANAEQMMAAYKTRAANIASMIGAASFYDLPRLRSMAIEFAGAELKRKPETCAIWFAALRNIESSVDCSPEVEAFKLICQKPKRLLDDAMTVGSLNPSSVKKILECK